MAQTQFNGQIHHSWESLKRTASKYVFTAKITSNKVCLDIACGLGYGSSYLMRTGARMVVGGDISQTSIEYAKTHYAQHGLHFCLLNAHRLPFNDESFDVVVSIETIEHLEKPMQFLSECYRVLKPGGEFVCSTPNKKMASPYTRKPLEPSHVKEFDIDELRSLAEEHFPSVTIVGQFYHKDSTWRLNILAGSLIGPFFRSFPKGESIIYFLNRFIFRRKYVTLSELDEMMATGLVKDDVLPFPQEGKDIGCIILVARK